MMCIVMKTTTVIRSILSIVIFLEVFIVDADQREFVVCVEMDLLRKYIEKSVICEVSVMIEELVPAILESVLESVNQKQMILALMFVSFQCVEIELFNQQIVNDEPSLVMTEIIHFEIDVLQRVKQNFAEID